MRLVKTQKILYNGEMRIRLIGDSEDSEYIRLIRKLPDCKWSVELNSWHFRNRTEHIHYLNNTFPPGIRFFDISTSQSIQEYQEFLPHKKISFLYNSTDHTVSLCFLYDSDLTDFLKKLGGTQSKEDPNKWEIRNDYKLIDRLNSYLIKANFIVSPETSGRVLQDSDYCPELLEKLEEKFRNLLKSHNYQARTIEQYVHNIHTFLLWSGTKQPVSKEILRDYLDELSIRKNFSKSYQNQQINSVKAFYQLIYGLDPCKFEIRRPKVITSHPSILKRSDVEKIISLISNPKHIALISFIYLTGTTIGETVSVKKDDLDMEKELICIRGKNGKQDRYLPMPMELKLRLKKYFESYKPEYYLFEGYKYAQYSVRCIQKVLNNYVKKAGQQQHTTVKTLRHSFACNLASGGIDITSLQYILGHTCRRSTEIYAKLIEK